MFLTPLVFSLKIKIHLVNVCVNVKLHLCMSREYFPFMLRGLGLTYNENNNDNLVLFEKKTFYRNLNLLKLCFVFLFFQHTLFFLFKQYR